MNNKYMVKDILEIYKKTGLRQSTVSRYLFLDENIQDICHFTNCKIEKDNNYSQICFYSNHLPLNTLFK